MELIFGFYRCLIIFGGLYVYRSRVFFDDFLGCISRVIDLI